MVSLDVAAGRPPLGKAGRRASRPQHSEIAFPPRQAWDDEKAISLFWDCLCHQETCYGATYAVIPHLLKIARPEKNRHQRLEIAHFCGFVVLCALDPRQGAKFLHGLPETVDEWDEKLDVFRSLAEHIEDAGEEGSYHGRAVELPRYKKLLAIGPVDVDDLDKIEAIRTEFFKALPKIRALSERALLENLQDESVVRHLLGGIAATYRLLDLARLCDYGSDGHFRCPSCGWRYEYILFGDRVAIYADERGPSKPRSPVMGETPAFLDYKEGAATRHDGFILPARDNEVSDRRAAALLSLAGRAESAKPALLLRHFLGSFECCICGAQGAIHPA
jgi:hypothetical protein